MNDINQEFLKEIKKFGIYKVANKSGVSVSTIKSWVYFNVTPSLINAQKVADAMGLEFLIFDKE